MNIALHNGKINDLEKFITGVRPKTAQLHAHYNDGKTDQHLHFNKTGEQYLKIVLGLLPKNLPIVCEARSLASVVKTKKLLEKIIN